VAEYLLREFLIAKPAKAILAPWSIVGPSIAAAGIALLFPVVVPKPPTYQLPPRALVAQKNPPIEWWNLIPVTLVLGGIAYIAGIILTELKGIP